MRKLKKRYGKNIGGKHMKKNLGVNIKQQVDKNKGITIIALIITIIVMLILLAVTVRMTVSSNLFGYAKESGAKWTDEGKREIVVIDNISAIIDTIINEEIDFLPTSPIYARLYEDGTFILSGTDYIDESKGDYKDYGDISSNKYNWDNLPEWSSDPIINVLVYDEIQPVNTSSWFHRANGENGVVQYSQWI